MISKTLMFILVSVKKDISKITQAMMQLLF